MTEKQVLFRIEARLLDSLDKKLAKDGHTTRNAWFKQAVSAYAGKSAAAKPAATKAAAAKSGKTAAKSTKKRR